MTVIADWIKTELHELGNLNIARSEGMTDSERGKSKNKTRLRFSVKGGLMNRQISLWPSKV